MASTGSFFEIPDPPRFKDARLAALYGYWHELGEEARGLPSIQAFDALRVPRILANIWIVEVVPDNRRFRIRLAGDNINAVYGRNVGGQFFRDVFEPGDLPNIIDRYTRALSEPSIFYATGSVYAAAGRLSSGERLGLPMLGRSGLTDTLLGATCYGERITREGGVLLTGDVAEFRPIRAANHRAPRIQGG
jgi:hypothetical protein